jgi:hypothetical protein
MKYTAEIGSVAKFHRNWFRHSKVKRQHGDRISLQNDNNRRVWRIASSGMLRRVALVRSYVSEELSASFIRVAKIGKLGRTASVFPSSPILVTLMMEQIWSSETSVLTRATRRNIPEDAILHTRLLIFYRLMRSPCCLLTFECLKPESGTMST